MKSRKSLIAGAVAGSALLTQTGAFHKKDKIANALKLLFLVVACFSSSLSFAIPVSVTSNWTGDHIANFAPNTGNNGYVIGIGAGENGTDRSVMSFEGFDASLGELTSVTLSYEFNTQGSLWAGAFSDVRTSGVSAVSSHRHVLNYGFDSIFSAELENNASNNSAACQSSSGGYYGVVPWNTTQLWYGAYCTDWDTDQAYPLTNNSIEFDSSLFDSFIDQTFQLELISTTYNSSITGCNWLSTCGMTASTYTGLTNVALIYTYDDGTTIEPDVSVPEPSSLALLGLGLAGLGFSRRRHLHYRSL